MSASPKLSWNIPHKKLRSVINHLINVYGLEYSEEKKLPVKKKRVQNDYFIKRPIPQGCICQTPSGLHPKFCCNFGCDYPELSPI